MYSRMYVLRMDHIFHQVLFDMPKNEDVTSSLTTAELHLTSLFKEMNTVAPTKSCVDSLPAKNEFKATSFLLYLKKLPLKSFRIMVASVNGKHCPLPRAPSVCDFQELSK